MSTRMLHYTTTSCNRSKAVTYCGIKFVTNHAETERVKRSGQWVTCPECELRKTLDDMGLEDERHQEDGAGYTQPTLF